MSPTDQRLRSLDVFRGLTIAGMILVNDPGSWAHIYPPLEHAEWDGWTPTDLVFPFFVFIMGLTAAMVVERREAAGAGKGALTRKVVVRAALLFLIGVLLNGFPAYDPATLRVMGVLQRLALCYLATGLIVLHAPTRAWRWWVAALLLGYWLALLLIPVPGHGAGVLAREGNLPQYVDALVLGAHRWQADWDPEGLLTTFPAIASCLLGALTWRWLRTPRTTAEHALGLMLGGDALLVLGWMWSWVAPINKNLWSSSYVLWTAGMAMLVLAACHWLVEGLGRDRWARPFEHYGRNALGVFVLSGVVGRLLVLVRVGEGAGETLKAWLYSELFLSWASPVNASLAFALAMVTLFWGVAYLMWRKRWFVRL
ncbi:MAG TPA: heparan-alpha-glucosaminide N-acetyltransferase domain-containing protein [Gemmatimonadales bacterium]|nr:heparan-alpha-glucosaminide N-acetyltransferase domain-containing protein [Gemmatimonadales bacterium]